jgi:hypothetical protein
MQKYEAMAGEHIGSAIRAMLAIANETGDSVSTEFNGSTVIVNPGQSAEGVESMWRADMDRRRAEREASPEGQESARRAEAARAVADKAASEGVLAIDASDREGWSAFVEMNSKDGYSACTVRYAARWASLMERRIAAGAQLGDIAKATSHEADVEGITGFMYGCAVGALAKFWRHGEELRRWHNLDTQIGNEGEKANETGRTLNPALLCVA